MLPSRDDPVVRAASGAVGGPAGRRVRPGSGWWTWPRVLLALTLATVALGVAQKSYCHDRGWPRDPQEYVHACYSDLPHLYLERGLADGRVPYLDSAGFPAFEYPVLTGAIAAGTAAVARALGATPAEEAVRFYDVNAVLLAALAALAVLATARAAGRRPWDAAIVALAPGLALTATINWDLAAVALTALGLLAWARRRPALAGVALGLATATKLYPVLVLGALAVLCLRVGHLRALLRTAVAGAGTWLLLNLPVALVASEGWSAFYRFSAQRPADFGSVWYVLRIAGWDSDPRTLNALVALALILAAGAVVALALLAPRRPRVAQVGFLLLVAFVLTNKVYSPQYVLWLLPFAALARPRWRDVLVWQVAETVYFLAVWMHLAGLTAPGYGGWDRLYGLAVLGHVAGTLWLAGVVVRDVLHPEHDPVRADAGTGPAGVDDPAGGVLDGAPDRLPVWRTVAVAG